MKSLFFYCGLSTLILFLTIISSSGAVQKADNDVGFSLFYNNDELAKQEIKVKKVVAPQILQKIHLKALFYSNPQTWTLWINDVKLSATDSHSFYQIHQVTPDYVILDWWYDGILHRIQLRPNQSYDATRSQVSEGLRSPLSLR